MQKRRLITVTLSPSIDRVIEAPGFAVGGHTAAWERARLAAGKGFNVARALAALGEPCLAAGLVGRDQAEWFGAQVRAGGAGLVQPRLVLTAAATRECLTIRDPVARSETHLRTEPPRIVNADADRLLSQVLPMIGPESIVALCGSVPVGAGLMCFETLLRECRARGARVAVDTSGAALHAARHQATWTLKINAHELAALTRRPTRTLRQVIAAARPLCASDGAPRIVIVTRGRLGAVMVSPRQAILSRVVVPQRRIVGTVGCGDAFLAGILSSQSRGQPWTQSMRLGVAAATALAVSPTPGTFTREVAMGFFRASTSESR